MINTISREHYSTDSTDIRESAFCAHTILRSDVFEIQDASEDYRFADHPWVNGPPHIRFYAGTTLRLQNDSRVGSLCVIDHTPRRLSVEQRLALGQLARCVVHALETRRDRDASPPASRAAGRGSARRSEASNWA